MMATLEVMVGEHHSEEMAIKLRPRKLYTRWSRKELRENKKNKLTLVKKQKP